MPKMAGVVRFMCCYGDNGILEYRVDLYKFPLIL